MLRKELFRILCISNVLLVAFVVTQVNVNGQQEPNGKTPFDPNAATLGGLLEKAYSQLLTQCPNQDSVIYFVKKESDKIKKNAPKRSAIPMVIQDDLGRHLNGEVWTQNRDSLARLLSFAYDSETINLKQNPRPLTEQIFKQDFTVNPTTFLERGTSYLVYSHNCSRIISAALKASGGYTLPIASIKGALNAEASNSNRQTFLYVKGPFISPFANLLFGRNVKEEDKLGAYMNLWGWYGSGVSPTGKHYIISAFNGVALFRGSEQNRKTEGNISASGSVTVPFASVEANANFAITDQVELKVENYDTFAFDKNGVADVETRLLPDVGQIKTVISSYSTTLVDTYTKVIEKANQPVKHFQIISGIPSNMCNRSTWQAKFETNLELLNVAPISLNSSTCQFEVQYTPPGSVFTDFNDLTLDYKFKSKDSIKTGPNAGDILFLELSASPVRYQKLVAPDFSKRQYEDTFAPQSLIGGNSRLTWNPVKTDVIDSYGIIDWNQTPNLLNAAISCTGAANVDLERSDFKLLPLADVKNRTVEFNISTLVKDAQVNIKDTMQCKLIGTMRFMKKVPGGPSTPFDKALPADLFIQFPKPATPPVAVPQVPVVAPTSSPSPSPSPGTDN